MHSPATENADFVLGQIQETVDQAMEGVNVRLATITCRCGWKRGITEMYRCLYCGEWMCELCAEVHFGMTREEYSERQGAEVKCGCR